MLVGTNLEYTKLYNYRIVLETIRLRGPVSRAEIARLTELTAQTITNITRKLAEVNLIQDAHKQREGRGAPSTLLTLNPEGAFAVGLDLDKDHLTGVLMDFVGRVRQRMHYDLNFPLPEEAIELLEKTARELIRREGLDLKVLSGVGVGLPGPLDIKKDHSVSNFVNPSAFPGWKNVPVAEILSRRLELPVFLENNATAAAVGERWYGAGQDIKTFFYVYFGAGLGGGLIIDGQPFEGHTGNAGELGFYPSQGDDDTDPTEERPHLGLYFNLPRLYRRLQEQGITVREPQGLEALYEQENPYLLSWIEKAADHLAPILLAIEYVVDPEAFFFGGRLPAPIIKAMMRRLKQTLPKLRMEGKASAPALLFATSGVDAAALGVATMPMYSSFAPTPGVLLKRTGAMQSAAFTATPPLS